jgi:TonB family protein
MVRGRHSLMCAVLLAAWSTLSSNPASLGEDTSENSDPVVVLDVIEVTGTTMNTVARTLSFPLPAFTEQRPASAFPHMALSSDVHRVQRAPQRTPPRILMDRTGETRGAARGVKPLKVERPPYPRMAREQGWQGKVVLRAHITPEGTVKNATIQESSGFPMLDDSALQAVKNWSFEPAKNGEFAVASTVALPIRFDLLR